MAIAVRQPGIPPALAQAGVQMVEADGWRAVNFPDSLKEKFTLLSPVSSFAQADPLYMPSVRMVKLDPNDKRLCYEDKSKKGERALTKHAIYLLAEAGGIVKRETEMIDRAKLRDDQIGWKATVYVRRSDGTLTSQDGSRTMSETEEAEAIEAQVRYYNKDKPEAQIQAMARSRVIKERDHWNAKCETKAVLRAMRGVLQIAHSYTLEELSKPFVVVGYSMTPDYNDPEIRKMLIEAGIGGAARMYGSPGLPEIGTAEGEVPLAIAPAAAEGNAPVDAVGAATRESTPTHLPVEPSAAPNSPGAYVCQIGSKHNGKTIAEIHEAEPGYVVMLAQSPKTIDKPERAHAIAFLGSIDGDIS